MINSRLDSRLGVMAPMALSKNTASGARQLVQLKRMWEENLWKRQPQGMVVYSGSAKLQVCKSKNMLELRDLITSGITTVVASAWQ